MVEEVENGRAKKRKGKKDKGNSSNFLTQARKKKPPATATNNP